MELLDHLSVLDRIVPLAFHHGLAFLAVGGEEAANHVSAGRCKTRPSSHPASSRSFANRSRAEQHILLDGVFGGGLESRVDRSEDATNIQLRDPERSGLLSWKYPWSWGPEDVLDWTLHLSDQIPLTLEIETYAGELTLELEALQIADLKVRATSSSTQISLPNREGTTTVNIEAITAKVIIRVPLDVAASIHNEFVIGMVAGNLARFPMLETERHYQSANYETATKRADIRIGGDTSSVEFV
jgi:hypothetical protein